MKRALLMFSLMLCSASAIFAEVGSAAESSSEVVRTPFGFIESFRPLYLSSGIPIDGSPVDKNTADVKFQLSIAFSLARNMGGHEGLDLKIGYTQRSIWYLYAESSPFKGNIFIPGIYLSIPFKTQNHDLLVGIEHRSNGVDDETSRSINYLFGEYTYTFPFGLTLNANARVGCGWYIDTLGMDLLTHFLGYASVGAMYQAGIFSASASIAPVFAPFDVNATVELAIRLGKRPDAPYHFFIQYHHGYDEALCDCRYGFKAPHYLRFGFLLTPKGCKRLSL